MCVCTCVVSARAHQKGAQIENERRRGWQHTATKERNDETAAAAAPAPATPYRVTSNIGEEKSEGVK